MLRRFRRRIRVNTPEDLLERGFQLASFILPEREDAVQALSNAMSKLGAQRSREKKRAYWRYRNLKRKITRIIRDDADALQWLIYLECEPFERRHEQAGQATAQDLTVRYVKHLVQATTAMSSFYVAVGLHRLLHNYSTSEVQRAYELVTEHYPGAEEYRKLKGTLMTQLQSRFQHFLKTCRTQHGEMRFEPAENQPGWAQLVEQCLRFFTPWSTRGACRQWTNLDAGAEHGPGGWFSKIRRGVPHDAIETLRCHVFIDPLCFGRLTGRLGLDSSQLRLAVPRFFVNDKHEGPEKPTGPLAEIPKLTEEERKKILGRLADEAVRQRQAALNSLIVLVDGVERARLEVEQGDKQSFAIQAGAKLIEIRTQEGSQDLLLATHWIDYAEWQGFAPSTATVALGRARELVLEIVPSSAAAETSAEATVQVQCRPKSRFTQLREALRSLLRFRPIMLRWLPGYAMAFLVLVAFGGIFAALKYRNELVQQRASVARIREELVREKAERSALQSRLDNRQQAGTPVAYRLVPDDARVRGQQGTRETVVSVPAQTDLVFLELPVFNGQSKQYRAVLRPFARTEILAEDSLPSQQAQGGAVVLFSLPASLVQDKAHYVLDLYATRGAASPERVRSFTFYVRKD